MDDKLVAGLAVLGVLYAINDTEYRMARNALRNDDNPRKIMNRFKRYNSVTGEGWQPPAMMLFTSPVFYFLGIPGRELAVYMHARKARKASYKKT